MIIKFKLTYTFNAPPKSLSLQDAIGGLRNITIKTSLIKRPTGDRIHSSNQQYSRLKFRKFTLDRLIENKYTRQTQNY